jgi:hemolysin activation/secretion protein
MTNFGSTKLSVAWMVWLLTVLIHTVSNAQTPPRLAPTAPRLEEEIKPLEPAPGLVLPPVPLPPEEKAGIPSARVFIREIRVTGNTVFSPEEIAQVTTPYTNRELSAEDLEALRVALTLLYVNKGYINSGAVLPDQSILDGVVTIRIIEGKLTSIEIAGNRWFRSSYLSKRLWLSAGPPFNVTVLQERLRLLLDDQRIARVNAEIKPGLNAGEGALDLRVEERVPYRLWLGFDNYQNPSVGEERGLVTIEHQNLTGNGDIATVQYGGSSGLKPLLDFKYSLPVNAYDTAVSFQYRKNTFAVVESPVNEIDVTSKSDIYTLGVRQPVYRTLNSEFALELLGERLSEKTYILGERFTVSPGAHNGRSIVTALRTVQEFIYRSQNQVIAARSRFSFGLNALGATINHNGAPDGVFFAWLGQFQWVRRLEFLDTQLIFRSQIQASDNPLMTLEQVAIGGRYSVRGYRENTLLTDEAFLSSFEVRVPLIRNARWADFVEWAPFVDFGKGWNKKSPAPDPRDISSVGVGIRWGLTFEGRVPLRPQFELYWGHRLRKVDRQGNTLQDNGIHLQFVLGVF